MVKKTLLLTIFAVALLFTACSSNEGKDNLYVDETYLIATCPTTYEYLKKINVPEEKIIQTESTAQVLQLLNAGVVQIAFVGRNAYANELEKDVLRTELFNRNTMISKTDVPLSTIQLREVTISTYLSENEIREYEDLKFKFIEKDDLKYQNQDGLILIPWQDFDEHIQQGFKLINIYDGLNKLDVFRNPQFYFNQEFEEIVKELEQKIKQ